MLLNKAVAVTFLIIAHFDDFCKGRYNILMFRRLKQWSESHKTLIAIIVALLFAVSQIPLLLNHEIWNDEATSWQLSREINLGNFYEVNSAEPHPILWQLILAPFSKANFPIITLNIISLAFVTAAVFVIFRFSKMNFFIKLAFLLSSSFFYFIPVISRDYSLVPLALALICIAYKSRHEKPFLYGLSLAFLSQTHFLMYGFMGALAIGYVVEIIVKKPGKKEFFKESLKFSLPILISIALVVPIVINSFNNQAIITEKAFTNVPTEYRDPFIPNVILNFCGHYNSFAEMILAALLALTAITFFIKNQKTFLYLLAGVGFWFFVMGTIYKGYSLLAPKVALMPLMMFATIWLNHIEDKKDENKVEKFLMHSEIIKFLHVRITRNWYLVFAMVVVLVTIPYAFSYAKEDMNRPFSNAKEIAGFINRVEPGSVIIEGDASSILRSAVNAYIENDVTIYNNILGRVEEKMDYLKYDNDTLSRNMEFSTSSKEELKELFDKMKNEYEYVYFITTPPSCKNKTTDLMEALEGYKEVARFNDEQYLDIAHARIVVYKIK